MYLNLLIGILLTILGLYLIINHKQYGKDTMDWYRNFYRVIGLKKMVKNVTKEDDKAESKQGLIVGIGSLLVGLYIIILFLAYRIQ